MNNTRRLIAMLLVLVSIFALTACGSAQNASQEDPLAYLNGQLRVGMECAYAPNVSHTRESAKALHAHRLLRNSIRW